MCVRACVGDTVCMYICLCVCVMCVRVCVCACVYVCVCAWCVFACVCVVGVEVCGDVLVWSSERGVKGGSSELYEIFYHILCCVSLSNKYFVDLHRGMLFCQLKNLQVPP